MKRVGGRLVHVRCEPQYASEPAQVYFEARARGLGMDLKPSATAKLAKRSWPCVICGDLLKEPVLLILDHAGAES